jgi:molybdopterin synthase sulfur carrier subunit
MAGDTITVLLFARYADLFGRAAIEIPAATVTNVASIVSHLRSLPGGNSLPPRPLVAVNLKQVDLDFRPHPGDEVALLPPMAGG